MRPNGVPNVTVVSKRRVCLVHRAVAIRALEWRLRVEVGPHVRLRYMIDNGLWFYLMDSRRYRRACTASYVDAHARPRDDADP
jgi:hypothetical protein